MIRKNKGALIGSSLLILLPMFLGLIFWNRLPDVMPTHWGIDNQADGWGSKSFAVFGIPLILLAVHWLCAFFTSRDPGNQDQNRKVFRMVLWVMPVISNFCAGIAVAAAFGKAPSISTYVFLTVGLLLAVVGNYLPKCKQNFTIGIKIKWTLESEENWNATHRFAGKFWVIGGLMLAACGFLPEKWLMWVMPLTLLPLIVIPMAYSGIYHHKQVKSGNSDIGTSACAGPGKTVSRISLLILIPILVLVAVMLFTGNIDVIWNDTSFTVEASFWDDLTVNYDAVDSVEYLEDSQAGTRTWGYASARLLMGLFQNDTYGSYTRYTYASTKPCVVLTVDDRILVLNGADEAATVAIYQTLLEKCGG